MSLRPIDAYYLGCDDGGTEHLHQLNQTHLTLFPRHTHTHTPEFIKSMNYKCGEHMCSPWPRVSERNTASALLFISSQLHYETEDRTFLS